MRALFDLRGLDAVFYKEVRHVVRDPATLAFAWAAYPFTQYVSSSNTNDAIQPALLIWGFWLVSSPAARGVFAALSGDKIDDIAARYGDGGYGGFKKDLGNLVADTFSAHRLLLRPRVRAAAEARRGNGAKSRARRNLPHRRAAAESAGDGSRPS